MSLISEIEGDSLWDFLEIYSEQENLISPQENNLLTVADNTFPNID